MNKRFVVSVVVIFVLSMLFGALIHGMLLGGDYARLATMGVYRMPSSAEPMMAYIVVANVIFAIGFTWVYRMGRESRPWPGQGLRFGIAVSVLSTIPMYLISYAIMPLPSDLVAKQAVLDTLVVVALGLVAAYINRDAAPARA